MSSIGRQPKVERIKFDVQSSAPSIPLQGDVYYQDGSTSLEDGLQIYDGTAYTPVNFSRQNLIMNGAFDFWQRGSSVTASGTLRKYADRWISRSAPGAGGVTVSRQSHTLNDLPGEPKYYCRLTAGTTNSAVNQRIRDLRTTTEKTYTLSFYARTSDSSNLAVEVTQYFGSGGSPSGDVSVASLTSATTTSFQKFTMTFTVPSLSGKTLGSNEDHGLEIYLCNSTGTSGTVNRDFSLVMMNEGRLASDFIRFGGSLETDLDGCEFYFQKSHDVDQALTNSSGQGLEFNVGTNTVSNLWVPVPYRRKMRVAATVTPYDDGGTAGEYYERNVAGTLTDSITAYSIQHSTQSGFTFLSSSGNLRSAVGFAWAADAEY